jgi:tight adherence protein B
MNPMMIGAIVAGLVAVVVIVLGIISLRSERDLIEERLSSDVGEPGFSLGLEDYEDEAEDAGSLRGQLIEQVDDAIKDREWAQKWRQQLTRADLKITVAEYAALHFVSMVVVFVFSYFIFAPQNIIVGILAGFTGLFIPRIYVARQVSQRLIRFEQQLPDTLGLWVNALRSGYSVLQAMEAISRDAPEPTATEFQRVVQEVQIGIDMQDALDHMLGRVASDDLDLVITAVNIQREVGGNLAEILSVIANTIRERVKLKGEIRVMTSQGRTTGYLISGLPIVLSLFLSVIQPGFMNPLFTNRLCGWPLIGIGLALIGMGTAAIQKISDIDI